MSIRSLFSTTVTSTESAVKGIVSLGSIIGDGTQYLKRHSSRINSAEVIEVEEMEYQLSLAERKDALVKRAKEISVADVVDEYEELKKILSK